MDFGGFGAVKLVILSSDTAAHASAQGVNAPGDHRPVEPAEHLSESTRIPHHSSLLHHLKNGCALGKESLVFP